LGFPSDNRLCAGAFCSRSRWPRSDRRATSRGPVIFPAYAHTAEASGGHLFLFDKSEVSGFSKFAIGDLKHKQTVVRAAGNLDSYTDIRIPVDQSIASMFITVTLQCMQTVLIYDPMSVGVHPDEMGGEDNWFRAGRIAIIPKPQPGVWTVRLVGMGPYFVSVQAEAAVGLHSVTLGATETRLQKEWSVFAERRSIFAGAALRAYRSCRRDGANPDARA